MHEFVHDGEFHVIQYLAKWYAVIGRIEDPNHSAFLTFIPLDVPQCFRLKLAARDHGYRNFPIVEIKTLPPKRQPFICESGGQLTLLKRAQAKLLSRRGNILQAD